MRIDSVSSQAFGALIYGSSIDKNILGRKSSRAVNAELQRITKNIKDEKLDSLKNVDIILEHRKNTKYVKNGGFYGVISPKEQEIPMHPDYTCNIRDAKESLNEFKKWAMAWEESSDPDFLDVLHTAASNVKFSPKIIEAYKKARLGL